MSNTLSHTLSNTLPNALTISHDEIIHQVKLAGQIPAILEGIATRQIVATQAAEVGIQVTSEELQQAADAIRLTNNLHRAEDTWAWLQKQGLSLDELEEMVEARVLSAKLAQYLFADKVEPYFVTHQIEYTQIAMYEVVLNDEDLAMELYYALQEGELDFHAIAHQYIQDKELRRTGGYRGLLHRTDLKPEISAAVFAATPPQILKPILTSKGVHLILVEEITQPQLDPALSSEILSELFSNWLEQKIKQVELAMTSETTLALS
jgi:parvulin-like peptidyl-prolyl isomerase